MYNLILKFTNLIILFSLLSIVLFLISNGLLVLNSIVYPTFSFRYFGMNSSGIFTIYSLVLLTSLFFGHVLIPRKISQINKVLLPLLSLISLVLIILEKINYPNYILEHLHLFPYSFIYLPLLSGVIFYISSFKEKNNFERKIRVLFPTLLVIFCYLWIEHYSVFQNLIKEDSILEYSQFIFYLLAALSSFKIFLQLKNNKNRKIHFILFLIFSIGLVFVSFEEISWGQRIFGWKTPDEIQKVNIQEEINIHNLFSYNINEIAYILVGFYGIFSEKIIKIFFKKKKQELSIFMVPKFLLFYFIFLFLVYFDRRFINFSYDMINNTFRKYAVWDWLEVGELYLAIAFWAYTKTTYNSIKTKFSAPSSKLKLRQLRIN